MKIILGCEDIFNLVISIASLLFLAFALGACHSGVSKADLVIANSVEPESLDPVIISGQAETRIVECLFEGLVRIAPQTGAPEPGLAHRWDVSNGGRTYVFHLRDNLVWSDGRPLKALDVEKSWMRSLSPKLAAKYVGLMFCIKGAKLFHESAQTAHDYARSEPSFQALDELRFRVELEKPTPYFLQLLTMPIFSVAPIHVIEENPTRWILESNVPVNGPYKLKWWKLNQSVRLVKNETYWDSENTSLDTVDLLPISNPSTALNLYLTGQVDIIWDKDLIPTQIVDEISKRMDYHQFDYLGTYFIRFNATHPPLDQPKIRRALSLSIDRQRITEKITRAGENPTSVLVPPGVHNYNPDHSYSLFDPEQANKLLSEAGYPNGEGFPTLEYYFNGASSGPASNHEKIAVELQAMWKKYLNINIRLKKNEWKVFLSDQRKLNYQISRSSWIGDYNDANTFLSLFTSDEINNRTGWENSKYDELISFANKSFDIKEREKKFIEAEKLLHKESPISPIYFYMGTHLWDKKEISGIHFNILDRHPIRAIKKKSKYCGDV